MKAPATGEPIAAATPWKSNSKPKAFVSLSKPTRSTTRMDLNEAKHARKKTYMNDNICNCANHYLQQINTIVT